MRAENSWAMAKRLRGYCIGNTCEVCGAVCRALIGHHITARNAGGSDEWWNCQLRCFKCEAYLHKKYVDGNSPFSLRVHRIHNEQIERLLPVTYTPPRRR